MGEAAGHGLLSLMAAREGIGHTLFHQAPPHDNPPLPTRPASELSTPNLYAKACADGYSAIWIQTMQNEHKGLADSGTFGTMKLPDGLNIVSAKGLFAWTFNGHGHVIRAKARLVARGFKRA